MQHNNSKLNTILLIILIILVGIGILLVVNKKTPQENSLQVSEQKNTDTSSIIFAPLKTQYIGGQSSGGQWPPLVTTVSANASCIVVNPEFEKAVYRTINGKQYCVQTRTEGAMGSSYVNYTYATGTTQIAFTLRFTNCGNYDEPQKTACETERANFNPDQIILDSQNLNY